MTRTRVEQPSETQAPQAGPQPPKGVRSLTVTWGEEYIQPVQFNGVRIGALEAVVDVPPGADPTEVYEQTWQWLDGLGAEQYRRKMEAFLIRLTDAGKRARQVSKV